MRAFIVAVMFAATACEGQLNPEWCSQHTDDQDCVNAGLVRVDAPEPCPARPCTETGALVCDTNRGGICVQCVMGDPANPPSCKCATDDRCHECVVSSDCASGLCLPDYTCVGGEGSSGGSNGSGGGNNDTLLYAAPGGTGDCTSAATPCTIKTALTKVDGTHNVIELAAGTYTEGGLTIASTVILIGPQPGPGHQYRDPTDASGRAVISGGNPVLKVTAGTVGLYELTIAGSTAGAGITCTNATLQVYHSIIRNNAQEGISATSCPLTVERNVFTKNGTTGSTYEAIYTENSKPIAIRNNFIYGNENTSSTKGAVHFHGATMGDFRFNTVAYNLGKATGRLETNYGGVLCESSMAVLMRDNLVSMNSGTQIAYAPGCTTPQNNYTGTAPNLAGPDDPHLTASSPPNAIVNNGNTDCSYAAYDIDFDPRPQQQVCDVGADEYAP